MGFYKVICFHLLFATIAGVTVGQDIDFDDMQSQISKDFSLPAEVLNNSTFEKLKSALEEKCLKNTGDENAFKEITDGATELGNCVQKIINVTSIKLEIEVAKPIGELDAVFHNYCLKRPDVLNCFEDFNKKVQRCLDEEENKSSETAMKIITGLLNFVCYKGGDQIALFIAEKGVECLSEKGNAIQVCLNKTLHSYTIDPLNSVDVEDLPKLTIGPKECTEMDELKTCIVDELQGCQEITPANIVESMFKFIRNETSCPDPEKSGQISISSFFSASLMIVLSLVLSKLPNL